MRKILIISIAIITMICLCTTVSAGLFDFGSSDVSGEIAGIVKSSNLDVQIKLAEGGSLDGLYVEDAFFNGTMEIELENATDDQLSYIKDNIDNLNAETRFNTTDLSFELDLYNDSNANYTLDGKKLKIDFDDASGCIAFEPPSGEIQTTSVSDVFITIPTDNGEINITGTANV